MEKRFSVLMWAFLLALLSPSFLIAIPANAACPQNAGECLAPPYSVPAEPVWATLNAIPQGNYPGGNMEFDVFVINSDKPPAANVTLINETLTAPAFPPGSNTNSGIGLPIQLAPGQAILNTIHLEIPSDFTQSNFTANLVAYVQLHNGTKTLDLQLTVTSKVFLLGLPGTGPQTSTSTSSSSTQTTQTTTQTGTVSTALFAAGVAIPSIVVVVLLILLVRGRGSPKGGR